MDYASFASFEVHAMDYASFEVHAMDYASFEVHAMDYASFEVHAMDYALPFKVQVLKSMLWIINDITV